MIGNGFFSRSQACVQFFGSSVQTINSDKFAVRLFSGVHVGTVCFFSNIIFVRSDISFDVGNFCSDSFGLVGCSISCASGSFGFACCSFCSFYFGIDVLFVFIDGFGQVSHDFFQTQTFKVVGFNIGCSCVFFGNCAVFTNVVDGLSSFETVDFLAIVVGSSNGHSGSFFNIVVVCGCQCAATESGKDGCGQYFGLEMFHGSLPL